MDYGHVVDVFVVTVVIIVVVIPVVTVVVTVVIVVVVVTVVDVVVVTVVVTVDCHRSNSNNNKMITQHGYSFFVVGHIGSHNNNGPNGCFCATNNNL